MVVVLMFWGDLDIGFRVYGLGFLLNVLVLGLERKD